MFLVDDAHAGLRRAAVNTGNEAHGAITEDHHLATCCRHSAPSGRKRNHRAILGDHGTGDAEPSLNHGELGQSATGGKDQLDVRRESCHHCGADCQAITGIEESSIDIAEQGHVWQRCGSQSPRAHDQ
jgi:hypothetical protein